MRCKAQQWEMGSAGIYITGFYTEEVSHGGITVSVLPFAMTSGPTCSCFLLRLLKRDRQPIRRKTATWHLGPPAVSHLPTAGPHTEPAANTGSHLSSLCSHGTSYYQPCPRTQSLALRLCTGKTGRLLQKRYQKQLPLRLWRGRQEHGNSTNVLGFRCGQGGRWASMHLLLLQKGRQCWPQSPAKPWRHVCSDRSPGHAPPVTLHPAQKPQQGYFYPEVRSSSLMI